MPAPSAPVAPARITLLTDFGTRDGYVAAMKGVIATRAPHAIIDDATHDIPPGDVHAAAWALAAYWDRYPAGTVHVAVVDPGVGSARRAIAVEADGRVLVGPDNGVFTRALRQAAIVRAFIIENTTLMCDVVSATFHGRDIFAPVAAFIAAGGSIEDVGPPVGDPVRLELPQPRVQQGTVHGVVVHVDRFGNLITNIESHMLAAGARVRIAQHALALVRTYADARAGEACALIGSAGMVEISVRDGSAASLLAAGRGAEVVVERA